ncbi:MAG: hypothetical protein LAO09_05980 [Acidobacteriia bacterium]|nr:hypothetical protein [Terriglobia bacterium]
MISKTHLPVLLIAASLLSAVGWAQPARLAPSCSNATLQGAYGFLITGTNTGNPIAIVGQILADGKGGLTGTETVSDNGGTFETTPVTGTYSIGSKCAGTAAITPKGGTAANYNLTVLPGKKVQLVSADSGTVQSGLLQAQGGSCSLTGVSGAYGIQQTGEVVGQGPLVFGGEIVLHANGLISGIRWGSVNGVISSGESISGAYKVDKTCYGGAMVSISNGALTFYNLQVVRGEHAVLFLPTEPGTVASGSWER